ncbi:PREDICTED: uncharacterized protein LOC106117980 [Papilio xuthus]|uniref:Uncharacterized protein LOC106117980 n=1 Tax=Papilio xuthus TaxID=66420 RepID=A0AAJ6Z9X6_PAPXU|nr:PREDICTED: uncharacterized protein LOC106117980 [Papilio xuthus]
MEHGGKEVNAEELQSTESKKSVTTSNVYSTDFTDYSSDKNNSSGKETYVIDWDDSEDSEASCQFNSEQSNNLQDDNCIDNNEEIIKIFDNEIVKAHQKFSNKVSMTSQICTVIGQETFTQTSKTIIELAESEGVIVKSVDLNTLQTQTSYISVTENKRIEYKIHNSNMLEYKDVQCDVNNSNEIWPILSNSFEDKSSKCFEPESDIEKVENDNNEMDDTENITNINEELDNSYKCIEDVDKSISTCSDIDDDSLMEYDNNNKKENSFSSKDNDECFSPKSISKEIEDLYINVSKRFEVFSDKHNVETQSQNPWARVLTPLTEESAANKESIIDMTPCLDVVADKKKHNNVEFYKQNKEHDYSTSEGDDALDTKEPFKLPPIENNKATNLCFLLSAQHGRKKNITSDYSTVKSECNSNNLAAGESSIVNETQRLPNQPIQLPPINSEPGIYSIYNNNGSYSSCSSRISVSKPESTCDSISIQDKIRELKMIDRRMRISESISPLSASIPECGKSNDTSYKGCELLCAELMRKLKSSSWCEVVDTLEEIPKAMEKFWNVITELRIADFIRQVTVHVDSPRSQVARTACLTLACILKNTNYTRKPDYYEAVTALLVKTGCFSRPVRRAANMALDEIVCAVDFTQTVTALCVHGVGHKSPLVRCAAARLLVVCCAVSGGGRGLLRGRPASAAAARRSALRALAELLQDKATDARKYAERLYSMLRPLSNFEAYFLTDVDVELASKQMKKYDKLLTTGSQDR